MRCGGHIARIGAVRNGSKIVVGKPQVATLHGRPRCEYKGRQLKADRQEMKWHDVSLVPLVEQRSYWGARECFHIKWRIS
jgi:hypothetical protein